MITIESNNILRDGELIGSIDGNKAYLLKKQGGVIIGQIKKAAGIDLDFDVVEELPTDKESLTVEPISDDAGLLSFPSVSEAESVRDVAGSATAFEGFKASQILESVSPDFDTSSFDCTYDENPRLFQQCFVNTYGQHGYSEWLKLNGK
jgi:hypothetical protein